METMSQCLRAWMEAEEISATALAGRLGCRSKTTVLRLLHGKSGAGSCRQLYERLRPGLSLDWQLRFERAVRAEETGPARYGVLEALERRLFRPGEDPPLPGSAWPIPPFVTRGQIILLGRCGEQAWVEGWLSLPDIGVTQYLTENELLTAPSALPALIGRVAELRYQAVLVRGDGPNALPWNTAFFTADGRAYLLYWDGEKASWLGLPGGADSLRRLLSGLEKAGLTPLYRFDQLKNGSDYMEFTEKAYRMERNRAALILKPTPGMQMMSAEAVKQSFEDFLARNPEPVSAARETLICTYENPPDPVLPGHGGVRPHRRHGGSVFRLPALHRGGADADFAGAAPVFAEAGGFPFVPGRPGLARIRRSVSRRGRAVLPQRRQLQLGSGNISGAVPPRAGVLRSDGRADAPNGPGRGNAGCRGRV